MLREFFDYRISVRQLFYLAVVVGVPYFAIGIGWLLTHNDHLADLDGLSWVFSAIGEVIAWPPLLIADIHLR